MEDIEKHATAMAYYLTDGVRCKFSVQTISESGSSVAGIDVDYDPFIAVYPEEFVGMGGGILAAEMAYSPVYQFDPYEADFAAAFCAALNFFADEEEQAA